MFSIVIILITSLFVVSCLGEIFLPKMVALLEDKLQEMKGEDRDREARLLALEKKVR